MKSSPWSVLALVLLLLAAPSANAWNRSPATGFATLPPGAVNPEGITADAAGNIYVTTFDPRGLTPGQVVVFSASGKLLRQVVVAGASPQLLGLAFHPSTGELLVIDFGPVLGGGAGQVLKVDPFSGASSVFMTATGSAGLNALTFDASGNVYVSDSFQGIIWKTGPTGGTGTQWVTSPLLTTVGGRRLEMERFSPHPPVRQDAWIVDGWMHEIGVDSAAYGTHSMRRTKATLIYRRTKNLRAVQLLLGHTKLESTVRYIDIEVDVDALKRYLSLVHPCDD